MYIHISQIRTRDPTPLLSHQQANPSKIRLCGNNFGLDGGRDKVIWILIVATLDSDGAFIGVFEGESVVGSVGMVLVGIDIGGSRTAFFLEADALK